jgi:hypothetical protein
VKQKELKNLIKDIISFLEEKNFKYVRGEDQAFFYKTAIFNTSHLMLKIYFFNDDNDYDGLMCKISTAYLNDIDNKIVDRYNGSINSLLNFKTIYYSVFYIKEK